MTHPFSAAGCSIINERQAVAIFSNMPDLVITYSIKPNIYDGFVCRRLKIPFCANVQGLGSAFEKPLSAQFVLELVGFFEEEYKEQVEKLQSAGIAGHRKMELEFGKKMVVAETIKALGI